MKTYEMVAQADKNGKMYMHKDMLYNKVLGFHDMSGKPWDATSYANSKIPNGLNVFIHADGWEELTIRHTMQQLFNMLGYEFELIGENEV